MNTTQSTAIPYRNSDARQDGSPLREISHLTAVQSISPSRRQCNSTNGATGFDSGYGRYIGRVSVLAVALGIGLAVTHSPAMANADTTGSTSSPADASSAPAETDSSTSSVNVSVAAHRVHPTRANSMNREASNGSLILQQCGEALGRQHY